MYNLYDGLWFWLLQAEEHVAVPSSASYVDYQTNMVRLAKDIARAAQDMVSYSRR